ncbi:MAG: hypothetical protein J5494_04255, partial [Candidatus Methanomethylophilaceae archaeon]|nr:hypothetical protein [Candidatus Methanomethylophilaceae archaeon]
MKNKITLEYLIEQALKIPKVKVDRAEFLKASFAKEGILIHQIVNEGPVASDYSDIELDDMAEKLILRRTSESSAMSFAAGIPGGLAIAATIPADTLQFFAMSLRLTQELAYLYGAKDFWACEGEDGTLVRYQLICSLGAMFSIDGASAATRLLSSHLAMRATGGTPQRATTRAFWDPIVRKISKDLTLRLTTDTASKGVAKLIPVIGGIFSGGMTFLSMRPMGQRLSRVLSTSAFLYDDSFAMKDYLVLEDLCEKAQAEAIMEDDAAPVDTSFGMADGNVSDGAGSTGPVAPNDGWGPMPEIANNASDGKTGNTVNSSNNSTDNGSESIPVNIFGDSEDNTDDGSIPIGGVEVPADSKEETVVVQDAQQFHAGNIIGGHSIGFL